MPAAAPDLLAVVASLSATVHAHDQGDGTVHIDLLSVPADLRGRGCARQALDTITVWADTSQVTLTLTATSALGSSVRRLLALYREYGFAPTSMNNAGEVSMRRKITPAHGF